MSGGPNDGDERARRFRDAALPHLDDAYGFAHFVMRNHADAEDALQECYLRALRHFDGYRGQTMKPWLLAILRNVCYAKLAQGGRHATPGDLSDGENAAEAPLWQEPPATPECVLLSRESGAAIRRRVDALPTPFREAIVLREFNDMSYREIALATGVPVGTVMSRLARGRAMLLAGWRATAAAARGRSTSRHAAELSPAARRMT